MLKEDKEYAEEMRKIASNHDAELAHGNADALLVEILDELGFHETVRVYNSVKKWYA